MRVAGEQYTVVHVELHIITIYAYEMMYAIVRGSQKGGGGMVRFFSGIYLSTV